MKKIKKGIQIILNLIGLSAIVIYPVAFLVSQNISEISVADALPTLKMFLLVCVVVFLIYLVLSRSIPRAVFNAGLCLIGIMNFFALERALKVIFPAMKYWHVLSVLLIILWIVFSGVKDEENLSMLSKVIMLVFWGLTLWNVVPVLPQMLPDKGENTDVIAESDAEESEMPNIYHLVFDEYSSIDFMKKYYDYDNSGLTDFLEAQGFNVSYSSSNEAYATKICMTNSLNMDFLFDMGMNNDSGKDGEITEKRWNNETFRLLREHGYQVQAVGIPEFYGLPRIEGGSSSQGITLGGETADQLLVQKTVFYPFYVYNPSNKFQNIQTSVQYLLNMEKPEKATYTLFHIELPHAPFATDANGNPVPGEHATDWGNKEYYKGAYIYATRIMREVMTNILAKDPNSIIWLCSDHSARAANVGYEGMFEEADKCSIFNALYYRGEQVDIEGLSGINTMRTIFNCLFNESYEMISTYPLMTVEEYHKNE